MFLDISIPLVVADKAGDGAEAGDVHRLVGVQLQAGQREVQRGVGDGERHAVVVAMHVRRAVGDGEALVYLVEEKSKSNNAYGRRLLLTNM